MTFKSLFLWLIAFITLLPSAMQGNELMGGPDPALISNASDPFGGLPLGQNGVNCPQVWGSQVDTNKFDAKIQVYSSGTFFQWQVSSDQGITWRDLRNDDNHAGVTTNVLSFKKVEQFMKDHQYRLKISNAQCSIYSETFLFPLAQIHLHPQDQCVQPYQQAVFTAGATGKNVTYRWQANYGSHWFDIYDNSMFQGTTTNQLRVTADPYWMNGHRFRVDVTVKDGFTLSSQAATLYIGEENCPAKPINQWTGARDHNWNNSANWSLAEIPSLETDAVIPSGLQRYPVIEQGPAAMVKDLIVEAGATVEIHQQWLLLSGAIHSQGSIEAGAGKLGLVGSEPQQLPGVLEQNQLADLMIQNAAGVTLEGPLDISRMVLLQEGRLYTNDQLRLLSSEHQTALIDPIGTGSISGEVRVQRYLPRAFGYHYLSGPVKDLRVGDFASYVNLNSAFPSVYRYQELNRDASGQDISGWVRYTDPQLPLVPMHGYAFNFGTSTSPVTLEVSGPVHQGDYLLELDNHGGTYTQGFHLVGNPYPSPIDWEAPGWIKSNIDKGIYFFRASQESQYGGTYTSYVSGVSSDGSLETSSVIPAMEGFFVHVSDPDRAGDVVRGQLGMSDAVRVNPFNQRQLRSSFSIAPQRPLLRLSAQLDQHEVADHMVLYQHDQADEDYHGEVDALKLMNTDPRTPNLYSLTPQGQKLSIDAIADLGANEIRLPLGVTLETSAIMRIELKDQVDFPAGMKVYLIDRVQKRFTNLAQNSYSFAIEAGEHHQRFELLLTRDTQALETRAFEEPFSAHPGRGSLRIVFNPKNSGSGVLSVYAVSGNLVETRAVARQQQMNFAIPHTGVYIVVLEEDGEQFTRKVLVK